MRADEGQGDRPANDHRGGEADRLDTTLQLLGEPGLKENREDRRAEIVD